MDDGGASAVQRDEKVEQFLVDEVVFLLLIFVIFSAGVAQIKHDLSVGHGAKCLKSALVSRADILLPLVLPFSTDIVISVPAIVTPLT